MTKIMTLEYDSLGIADAREIRDILRRAGEVNVEIVCNVITEEAQNALLKILEEPALGMSIRLTHPNPELLLPTFRSRLLNLDILKFRDLETSKLDEIEQKLHNAGVVKNALLLREILHARKLLDSPAAVPRAILEHATLAIQNLD
ncbi:MAG TPA: hypothetical protein VJK09_02655 [Candidatus Paceibacterota bacterium]